MRDFILRDPSKFLSIAIRNMTTRLEKLNRQREKGNRNPDIQKLDAKDSGTTLVFGAMVSERLYVCNVGDSRCVLGTRTRNGGDVATSSNLSEYEGGGEQSVMNEGKQKAGALSQAPSQETRARTKPTSAMRPKKKLRLKNGAYDVSMFDSDDEEEDGAGGGTGALRGQGTSSDDPNDHQATNVNADGTIAANTGSDGEKVQAVPLSMDHKPDVEGERARITSMGGRVAFVQNTWRVLPSWTNKRGLAVSRSIGDFWGSAMGVSAVCDVKAHVVDPNTDMFVIFASDGVWEYVANMEAVRLVHRHWLGLKSQSILRTEGNASGGGESNESNESNNTDAGAGTGDSDSVMDVESGDSNSQRGVGQEESPSDRIARVNQAMERAARELCEKAKERWIKKSDNKYVDDITAVIVVLSLP